MRRVPNGIIAAIAALAAAAATAWIMQQTPGLSFPSRQGILAGMVVLLGAALIHMLPKYKWLAAGVLLAVVTPMAIGGFWFSTGQLGISDWDYYFSYHTALRRSIVEYGVFPLWNPYTCGGTSAIGDPEFPVFTPTFLLELVFGVPAGLRLAILFSTAVGATGMLTLCRRLGLSVWGGLIAALAAAFGTVNLLEIVEGHPNVFAAMYIPWIFWAWAGAYRRNTKSEARNPKQIQNSKPRSSRPVLGFGSSVCDIVSNFDIRISNLWSLLCGLFLALTFFQGGIYLLMYTGLALAALVLLVNRRLDALKITLAAAAWAVGLAAIKLVPVLLWLTQFQDAAYAVSTYTLPYLHKIFLGRYLHDAGEVIPNQGGGWHEYGAYVGPVVLLLALIGAIGRLKRRGTRILIIGAVLAIILSSSGPTLKPLFDAAPFLPRSNISRTIIYAVLPIALLAGLGLDVLRQRLAGAKLAVRDAAALLVIGITAMDLISLAYPLSGQAFVLPRVVPSLPSAPTPIAYSAYDYRYRSGGTDYTRAYEATLAGYGSLSYCAVIGPPPAVRTIHDEVDTGILSLSDPTGSFKLVSWTPNAVRAMVSLSKESEVILNANYSRGWWVNDAPAQEINSRVGMHLPAGTLDVIFSYRAPGFMAGMTVTFVSLLGAGYTLWKAHLKNQVT